MPPQEHRLATSVLVVGTGASGLRAAIELAEAGVAVLAVGKRPIDDAHTVLTTGGINAALATADSWEQHAADTLLESCLLADPRTVQLVARNAAQGIHDLQRYGMQFDRQGDGGIAQRCFGAHTYRRTAFAGNHTGREVQRVLREHAARLAIPVLATLYITRLLVNDGTVFGAYGFDLGDGSRLLVHADAVIVAAGGHTRIWRRTSSRRHENSGDALRLATDAGAQLRDAELIQFHPSGLLKPEHAGGTLVSETARGEGGILLNNLGERFMARYDPERMELSTRDRVAVACYTEISQGRGTLAGGGMAGSVPPSARDRVGAAAPALPDPAGSAEARHHSRSDRNCADRPLFDGRSLGPTRRSQHRHRRAFRHRRSRQRVARRESPRRQFTD